MQRRRKWPFVLAGLVAIVIGFAIWGPGASEDSPSTSASSSSTDDTGGGGGGGGGGRNRNRDGNEEGDESAVEPDLSAAANPSGDAIEPEGYLEYPIPEKPDDCPGGDGDAVTVRLGGGPDPLCVTVDGDQGLTFENTTEEELVVAVGELQETVLPGDSFTFNALAGSIGTGEHYFWSPGHQELSGIVVVA